MDGGPHQKIEPNTTWSATYTINQNASTNWYHPHLMGKTAEHAQLQTPELTPVLHFHW